MGGVMSQINWVSLGLALIAYNFVMHWAERWHDAFIQREYKRWKIVLSPWMALKPWVWQTSMFVAGNLAASSAFLYFANNFVHEPHIRRDAIMGLIFTNVFFYHFWSPLILWGPRYWWLASLDSAAAFVTSIAAVILMGIGKHWLPFGLYLAYSFWCFCVIIISAYFWYKGTDVTKFLRKLRGKHGVSIQYEREDGTYEAINGGYPMKKNRRKKKQQMHNLNYDYRR
jgi:hypothetical protein